VFEKCGCADDSRGEFADLGERDIGCKFLHLGAGCGWRFSKGDVE
jgi:hypothetical protein